MRIGYGTALLLVLFAAAGVSATDLDCGDAALTGRVLRVVRDDDPSYTATFLHDPATARTYKLDVDLPSGTFVRACQGRVDVVAPPSPLEIAPATDPRRIVVLLVNFTDAALTSRCTPAAVADTLIHASDSVDEYYREAAFGQIAFAYDADANGQPDIFGPLSIASSIASPCDIHEVARQADEKATEAGVDLSRYAYRVYVTPDEADCGNWGSLGCSYVEGATTFCRSWLQAMPQWWPEPIWLGHTSVFAHELGHNLGVHHASTDFDLDGVVDPYGEYGDGSDVMGQCCGKFPHFNGPHKGELGLWAAYAGSTVSAPATGGPHDYTLAATTTQPGNGDPPRMVRFGDWYASTRVAAGFDGDLDDGVPESKQFIGRTSIHRFETAEYFPRTLLSRTLGDGDAFADPVAGYLVEQTGHTANTVQVRIRTPDRCVVEIAPGTTNFNAQSATGAIAVRMPPACPWTAAAPEGGFVTITGGAAGSGDGTVTYSVAQNSGSTGRKTTLTIAGKPVPVTQSASGVAVMTLTATATAANVTAAWSAVANAISYQVERSAGGGAFAAIATTANLTYVDPSVSAGTGYLYRVVALAGAGALAYSNVDLAVPYSYADPVVARVKATHVTQLRQALNAARAALGWPAASPVDPTNAGVVVRSAHLAELRSAVNAVRAAIGAPATSYTDPTLTAGVTPIRATHVTQLRSALQ